MIVVKMSENDVVDTLGLKATVKMIEDSKLPVPSILANALAQGQTARFYTNPHGNIGRFFVAG